MKNGRTGTLPVPDYNSLKRQKLSGFLVSNRVPARRRRAAHRPFNSGTFTFGRGFSKAVEDLSVSADEISIAVEPLASSFFVEAIDFDSWPKRGIERSVGGLLSEDVLHTERWFVFSQ